MTDNKTERKGGIHLADYLALASRRAQIFAAFLLVILFALWGGFKEWRDLLSEFRTQTAILLENVRASMPFHDAASANQLLETLLSDPNVEVAALYLEGIEGPFATVARSPAHSAPSSVNELPDQGLHSNLLHIVAVEEIQGGQNQVGWTYVRISTRPVHMGALLNIIFVFFAIGGAIFIARRSLVRFHPAVHEPIDMLSEAMKKVSAGTGMRIDYPSGNIAEINILINGFNSMLEQIRARDAELEEHQQQLEQEIKKQTRDIRTANQQLEEANKALSYKKDETSALLDNLVDCVVSTDQQGIVLSANPAVTRILGYSPVDIIGQNVSILIPDTDCHDHDSSLKRHLEVAAPGVLGSGREVEARHRDGHRIPVLLNTREYFLRDRRVFVVTLHDITEKKKNEQALIAARDAAEQANEAKTHFLSSMSHELRTPLNAILGYAQLFEFANNLNDQQRANIAEVERAARHLLELVGQVLDLAEIESGKLSLSMEPVALPPLIEECLTLVKQQAETHHLELIYSRSENCGEFAHADRNRLKQVLLNLLSNAIKYNQPGGQVRVTCKFDEATSVWRLSVTDTGRGIKPKLLNKLFQTFERLGIEKGAIEGAGIGLIISKELVESMKGKIGVESTVGVGSTFWVELSPALAPATVADDARDEKHIDQIYRGSAQKGCHVLIVEDNEANRAVLEQQLELLGYTSGTAIDGKKGLREWETGNYELVLSDINMPRMDGYRMVKSIREKEQAGSLKRTPIIAITANAGRADRERALAAGMDDYISKPVHLKDLGQVLARWRPEAISPQTPEHSPAAGEEAAPAIDPDALSRQLGEDRALHARLLCSFADTTPDIIAELHAACGARQAEAVGQLAHKLKSSARAVGANALADLCQSLELASNEEEWSQIDALEPRLDGLFGAMKRYIENFSSDERAQAATTDQTPNAPSVLLIDDDQLILDIEQTMLNKLGVKQITTATNGHLALELINQATEPFDLILCDLLMPEMDGVEFLRHIGENKYCGAIALVSGVDERVLNTAMKLASYHRLNVLGVLNKPLDPGAIETMLGRLSSEPAGKQSSQGKYVPPKISADDLRRGLEDGQISAFYQPQVDVTSKKVVGLEALARWIHPIHGIIPPDIFIPLAEKKGLIDDLTRSIYHQAVVFAATLFRQGYTINMSVNMSLETLHDLGWPEFAVKETVQAGISPSQIILEVTESRLINNLSTALEILARLRLRGFRLSIDDFGTGYSSMEQLQRIPACELKIDKAFVSGAADDMSTNTILESSVYLGKRLNMSIVAEGVETQQDWDRVAALGCDLVQGYFIAKPMDEENLTTWLKQWKP